MVHIHVPALTEFVSVLVLKLRFVFFIYLLLMMMLRFFHLETLQLYLL